MQTEALNELWWQYHCYKYVTMSKSWLVVVAVTDWLKCNKKRKNCISTSFHSVEVCEIHVIISYSPILTVVKWTIVIWTAVIWTALKSTVVIQTVVFWKVAIWWVGPISNVTFNKLLYWLDEEIISNNVFRKIFWW